MYRVRYGRFFNPADEPSRMAVALADLDLGGAARAADLTMQQLAAAVGDSIVADVPAHGCRIYRVDATERLQRATYPAADAWLSAFQEIDPSTSSPRVVRNQSTAGNPTLTAVEGLGGSADNRIEWRKVHVLEQGNYALTISALSPLASTAVLTVDGEVVPLASPTATVALSAGTHVIALTDPASPLPPLSHLVVDNF